MISRKEHLEQINRFHDIIESLSKKIESLGNGISEEKYKLLMQYNEITSEMWPKVDDYIDDIKNMLDIFQEGK